MGNFESAREDDGTFKKQEPFVDNVNNRVERPDGNSASSALRRLRKDRPDLHARVLADELSPHAAMVEAGFRRKTVCVPLDLAMAARANGLVLLKQPRA